MQDKMLKKYVLSELWKIELN